MPGCVPEDPNVPGPDCCFGDDLAPINGNPFHHCFDGLLASADWMTRALDIQGYRLDDVKGISTQFIPPLLNYGALKGKFAVGEFFDGNLDLVRGWISNTAGRASAFDFPLRFNLLHDDVQQRRLLRHVATRPRRVWRASIRSMRSPSSRTTTLTRQQPQSSRTRRRDMPTSSPPRDIPASSSRTTAPTPAAFGMKPIIDNLIFIHERIADGATQQRFKSFDVFAYERLGRGAPAGRPEQQWEHRGHTITVDTGFGANVKLHDYTGHSGDVQTDGNGRVTITIPKNTNGFGYVCYSRAGIGGPFEVAGQDVTQDYEGAQDLDIKPADNTTFVQVCRVFVAAGQADQRRARLLRHHQVDRRDDHSARAGRPERSQARVRGLRTEHPPGSIHLGHGRPDRLLHLQDSLGQHADRERQAVLQALGDLPGSPGPRSGSVGRERKRRTFRESVRIREKRIKRGKPHGPSITRTLTAPGARASPSCRPVWQAAGLASRISPCRSQDP